MKTDIGNTAYSPEIALMRLTARIGTRAQVIQIVEAQTAKIHEHLIKLLLIDTTASQHWIKEIAEFFNHINRARLKGNKTLDIDTLKSIYGDENSIETMELDTKQAVREFCEHKSNTTKTAYIRDTDLTQLHTTIVSFSLQQLQLIAQDEWSKELCKRELKELHKQSENNTTLLLVKTIDTTPRGRFPLTSVTPNTIKGD